MVLKKPLNNNEFWLDADMGKSILEEVIFSLCAKNQVKDNLSQEDKVVTEIRS